MGKKVNEKKEKEVECFSLFILNLFCCLKKMSDGTEVRINLQVLEINYF